MLPRNPPAEVSARPSLRELEALSALIATRKTVAAAHALGVSQPAISRAIASLEQRVGRSLFVRDGGRLRPTADAYALEREGRAILDALDALGRGRDGAEGGVVRIVASPTLAQYLLPDLLDALRRRQPSILPQIEIGTGTAVVAAVADRLADIGLVDSPSPHPAVRAEPLREANAHCIIPEDHPLAARERIEPPDLDGQALIALARRFASRVQVDRIFATAGVRPNVVAEVSTSAFAVQLVRQGLGFALLNPFPMSIGGLAGLAARPFHPAVTYTTMLLFPAFGAVSPVARALADALKAEQAEDGLTFPIRN